jgi:ubiquinone/menaquinone biosynthesis C-methylase UbiE
VKLGDFTGLADDYARFRPGYSDAVLDALIGLLPRAPSQSDFADVGAGTGIWTALVARRGFRSCVAVEPNRDMRERGAAENSSTSIAWREGSGEATGLADGSVDLLSMASSFHWVDFDKGVAEFARVLRPHGLFCALWNPREARATPLLAQIDSYLQQLGPEIKRVSSGKADFTTTLAARLEQCGHFRDVLYLESRHYIDMTKERYIGAWRSVNDLQAQLGAERFASFLSYLDREVPAEGLRASYLTRAWIARKS